MGDQAFAAAAPTLWNSESLQTFKTLTKTHLFKLAFPYSLTVMTAVCPLWWIGDIMSNLHVLGLCEGTKVPPVNSCKCWEYKYTNSTQKPPSARSWARTFLLTADSANYCTTMPQIRALATTMYLSHSHGCKRKVTLRQSPLTEMRFGSQRSSKSTSHCNSTRLDFFQTSSFQTQPSITLLEAISCTLPLPLKERKILWLVSHTVAFYRTC